MAEPTPTLPVKLFAAVLYVEQRRLDAAKPHLTRRFGEIDYVSPPYPFAPAAYYAPEMGSPIMRLFLSFAKLIAPETLPECKLASNEIEDRLAERGKRTVNIDAGYIDHGKVVLASMKGQNHKIYLGRGVYADMNLLYAKGHYKPLPWTFPDFRNRVYEKPLLHIRALYKAELRRQSKTSDTED